MAIVKTYSSRAKAALNKNLIGLTFLDRVKLLAGIVPAKNGLIYDQIYFSDLSIREIEKLSDYQGGYYYPPKHRRKSMTFLNKAIEQGTLILN